VSAHTSPYGTTYEPDPATVGGEFGYRDEDGTFRNLSDLEEMASAVLLRRPDGRSPKDVLAEMLTDASAIEMLMTEVFQPDDIAAWALNPDTGRWDEVTP